MNAFRNSALAALALSMPLSSSMAQTSSTPPQATAPTSPREPNTTDGVPDDWIFIPPYNETQNNAAAPESSEPVTAVMIETPISINGQCVLTTSYTVFSMLPNPQERAAHQRLINQWAQANEASLVEFASSMSTASFRVIGDRFSASSICQNDPEMQGLLREAFTASTALFTQGLHQAYPTVIKDGTGFGFNITGFQEQPIAVPVRNIALNYNKPPMAPQEPTHS